jgi:potassium-transporting ATPase KdpC subunit
MIKELGPGFRLTLIFTILLGLVYPLAMTGISQAIFPRQANGNMVEVGGKVVGSSQIAQGFSKPEYFHPRPSAAGSGYDGALSAGSNLGPTSAKLLRGTTRMDDKNNEIVDFDGISLRVVRYCLENEIPFESSVPFDQFKNADGSVDEVKLVKAFSDENVPLVVTPQTPVPADAVTASSSGLDPHISPANADIQAARVARTRGVSVEQVEQLIAQNTNRADLGFLGEPGVNVFMLNIALDQRFPVSK